LGEPQFYEFLDETHKSRVDTYIVKGRIFNAGDYVGSIMGWEMTLGLHELILFPLECWEVISEAVCPTEKKLQIRYHDDGCNYNDFKSVKIK